MDLFEFHIYQDPRVFFYFGSCDYLENNLKDNKNKSSSFKDFQN